MVELTKDQQIRLLKLARKTIAESLGSRKAELPDFCEEIFQEKCGCFVTLHIRGNLRGCIGYIQGIKCIPDTVCDMAKASAFKDPRFASLSQEELDLIDIEISILSPIEPVREVSEIKVGRDGLIITRGHNCGLLLPQVAIEQGWDRNTFLEHTCYKAGLAGNAWQIKGTRIEKFSAQVFGERELGLSPQAAR